MKNLSSSCSSRCRTSLFSGSPSSGPAFNAGRSIWLPGWLNAVNENSNSNENKDLFWFQKPLVSLLFDYNRWNRPFRYIKNNRFEQAVRTEMSQYFFDTCKSDGKQRISFTYPPSLSTFWKMQRWSTLYSIYDFLPGGKVIYMETLNSPKQDFLTFL